MQTKNDYILNQQKPTQLKINLIFSHNQAPNQRYIFKKLLERGGFGDVSLYYDTTLNKDVIIKQIRKLGQVEEKEFNREITAMKNIKCQNSVEYYDHFDDKDFYYIVMEKCDEDLTKLIERNKGGISDSMIKNILLQLNKAFKMMNSKNLIHRDLKPANILIKYDSQNNFIIKLSDFGLSRVFNNQNFSTNKGTFGYSAPEQGETMYNPTKSDLWSIGVIIYVLKFNDVPYMSFYQGIIPEQFDNKLLDDLVRRLIVIDPDKRMNWEEYFAHPFFKN